MINCVQIEPTTRCNLNCPTCTHGNIPLRDLQHDILRMVLWEHPEVRNVKLQGLGEPFLTPHIGELLDIIKHEGCKISTITNGMIYIPPNIARKFDMIIFSINSLNPERYQFTKPGGNLNEVLENLHAIRGCTKLGVNQVFSEFTTAHDIADMHWFCNKFNIVHIQTRLENWYAPDHPNWPEAHEMVMRERLKFGSIKSRYNTCQWGLTKMYFDSEGIEHPCCIRMNDEYRFMNRHMHCCKTCPD